MTPPLDQDVDDRPGWAEAPRIDVEDLGEAVPPPFAAEAEHEAAPPAAPLGLSTADVADRLLPLIRAPFSIAGLALSRRYPAPNYRAAVVELWQVSEAEARPIAEALAPVIPAHWLVERALTASPWGAAGVQLYQLASVRLDGTAAIAQQWEAEHGAGSPVGPGSSGGNGAGPPGAERGAVAADDRRDGYEGAGLGV